MQKAAVVVIQAAEGYFELGLLDEAANELEKLEDRIAVQVWASRLKIFSRAGRWDAALDVAKHLVARVPHEVESWLLAANAARHAQSVEAAYMLLRLANGYHADSPMIQYRLACYESQLGNFATATENLRSAVLQLPSLKHTAIQEPDLQPLWDNFGMNQPWQKE